MVETKAAHVLVIPFVTEGHISPLLNLATQLARRGVPITFVCTEDFISRHSSADGDGSAAELRNLGFRFVGLPLPEGPNHERPEVVFKRVRDAFEPVLEKMLRDKDAGCSGGPTSIISDMFLAWTQEVAEKLQIPRYVFVSSGAIFARFLQGCVPYYERGQFQASATDGRLVKFDFPVRIPGLPPLRFHELTRFLQECPSEFRNNCTAVGESAGILVNSFLELEEGVIETSINVGHPRFEHLKVPKIYPIGPLFSMSVSNVGVPPPGLEDTASKSLLWLDSQPPSSVLYVAFGSLYRLAPEQVHELALGLEDSKQRFLWVIPELKGGSGKVTPSLLADILPPGFEARVGDRGCIVTGWAPQLQILAHSSIGGFLTHCGWNSSLESIIFGVPMISWPQGAEQHLNCRYLVDDLKIAEQLQAGSSNILKQNEVERVVRCLMSEPEGRAMRSRVEELQRKAAAAMADGGSRSKALLEFLDAIHNPEQSPNLGRE